MKIQIRFTIFLTTVFALISLFVIVDLYFNYQHAKVVIDQSENQLKENANSAFKSHSSAAEFTLADYTYWTDLITYVNAPSERWFEDNFVQSLINPLKLGRLKIFDKNKHVVKDTYFEGTEVPTKIIDANMLDTLYKRRKIHYYEYDNDSIIEIFAYTIHPSTDSERKTEPQGYFIAARYLDQKHIGEIEELAACKIRFRGNSAVTEISANKETIVYNKALYDWKNNIIATAEISRENTYYKISSSFFSKLLWMSVLSAIILISFILYFFKKWVNNPLQAIQKMLDQKTVSGIEYLKSSGIEFKEIGLLIEKAIQQEKDLIDAKLKAEESDKLKSAFLSNISHEFRTPMNAIMGFSSLIISKNADEEKIYEYLQIIHKNSSALLDLLHDVIDIAMLETGDIVMNEHKVNINEMMDDIHVEFTPKVTEKSLNFDFQIPEDECIHYVTSDSDRLKQAINNVLNNALKFTKTGYIHLGYKINNHGLLVYVRDTGIGINPESGGVIFEPFRQVETILTRRYPGTGLGLSLSKAIVTRMGGKIWFESEPDKGTSFYMNFPFKIEFSPIPKEDEQQLPN